MLMMTRQHIAQRLARLERIACNAILLSAVVVIPPMWLALGTCSGGMDKVAGLETNILAQAVGQFVADNGHPPEALRQLVPHYLKELHQDPWGHDYLLARSDSSYSIVALGDERGGRGAIVSSHPLQTTSQDEKPERQSP